MKAVPSSISVFSPHGFLPHVRDADVVAEVAGGSVWGTDDVARLRAAGLVRVRLPEDGERTVLSGPRVSPEASARKHPGAESPESSRTTLGARLGAEDLTLRTLLWLSLAGVPVAGPELPEGVRGRLDPDLLALLDRVGPATVSDPGARELLSLALRRRARELAGHPPADLHPPVAVLLPVDELSSALAADLEAQTWTAVVCCPVVDGEATEALAQAREAAEALYCTRMGPGLRYGPHHLADLVEALRHSGAKVAHSPARFRPWRDGAWLEDDTAGIEGPAPGGLPDGSLWYAVDGPEPPVAPQDGYAVHGAGAVPAPGAEADLDDGRAVALRLHSGTPTVLDWLTAEEPRTAPVRSTPESYFVKRGAPSRARNSSTASES